MPIQPAHRRRGDLCPGLLRPFPAEDGAIIRLRLPGGAAPVALLTHLLQIAREGAGFLQLTSRGNIQLRGLPDPLTGDIVDAVMATGLIPSPAHERVRNILASPLSGWWPRNVPGGPEAVADVRSVVAETDRLLCADPDLAGLPGRFLFAVDDGRGDLLGEPFDIAYRAVTADSGEVRLAGASRGCTVSAREAASALIDVARAFQQIRRSTQPAPWHVRELDADQLRALLRAAQATRAGGTDPWEEEPAAAAEPAADARSSLAPDETRPAPRPSGTRLEPGPIGPHAVVGLPLGRITAAGLNTLAQVTDTVLLTPWRSLVVPGAADRLAELTDFATGPDSGWARISACTGTPGCARGRANTEAVARDLVAAVDHGTIHLAEPVHLVACDRHCGATAQQRHLLLTSDSAGDVIALLR
ncbi:MAG: precorrin-3B synthase [Propionibacteriaceae bacterium]|nr:precorrin-3B synthase [Propionibacteriaceae bacterium]